MFGDFNKTFGLNFAVDNNGGLFPSLGTAQQPTAPDAGGLSAAPLAQGTPAGSPAPTPPTSPSPLASALAPGQATGAPVATDQPSAAPAAGLTSPFGKGPL